MRKGFFVVIAALCGCVPGAVAQARPECPAHPSGLAAMRGCYRPLLVFAPSASDPRLKRQQAALDAAADDMMDRDVLYLPVVPATKALAAPLDTPYGVLGGVETARIRRRFGVAPDAFAVVLLGEDGSAKLRAREPVPVEKLNSLIDTMPTRKEEMQRPHSN